MVSKSATTSYCLWVVGVIVLIALVYLLCNMGKRCSGGGGSGYSSGSSACASGGKMAQRGQAPRPPSLRGGRATVHNGGDEASTTAHMTRISTGSQPRDDVQFEGTGCQTKGADMSQFLPKSASIDGNKKGANTRAHQLSQSGRLDYASLSRTIGLNDRAWLPQVSIQLGGGCVSFNDSEMRQSAIMSMTNCDQTGSCPFPPHDKS